MSDQRKPLRVFRLTQAYSLVSFIGILIVAIVIAFFYRTVAVDALMNMQDKSNIDLTRVYANSIWDKYSSFFNRLSTLAPDQLIAQPEIELLTDDVQLLMRGMRVFKVKIYSLNGITIFSTESKQIAEDQSSNPGFQRALQGEVVSNIVFRDMFNSFDKTLGETDHLASYIPVYYGPHNSMVGVFELYSDITTLIGEVKQTEYTIVALVISLMLVLYAFLLVYVRRADGIIKQHEIAERTLRKERMLFISQHDQLTGIPNRNFLLTLLNQAISRARISHRQLAVFYLDIDRFKLLNDNLGHEAGDHILLVMISRLQEINGEQNIIARIGGDELVLVSESTRTHFADSLARRILHKLSEPIAVAGVEVTLTVSIGITLFKDDKNDADHLLKNAEAAMLRTKQLGRNRYTFYTEELNAIAGERFEMERGLHKALANHEFELLYQPRVDANSAQVIGAEALLRWRRKDGNVVSPVLFIPILEEMGLIIAVGKWALRNACKQCRAWQEMGYADLRISVNLSVRQFHADSFVADVSSALHDSGLDASHLELEVTESLLIEDFAGTAKLLNELKDIGVHLSIDDFGTGYSSLSYLMHFPVDCLKIDRAFVRDAITNTSHANLTRTIVAMAKSLHLKTVAEGVETQQQREFLQELDCNELQGDLFSRPLDAGKFLEYLAAKH